MLTALTTRRTLPFIDLYEPFAPLAEFEHMMEHVWDGSRAMGLYPGFDVDIWDEADRVYIEAELPGMERKDVDITVENNVLTISGQKSHEGVQKDHVHHLRERYFGSFSRSFTLPSTVDPEKIEANLEKGVLRVILSKREQSKARHIPVKGQ